MSIPPESLAPKTGSLQSISGSFTVEDYMAAQHLHYSKAAVYVRIVAVLALGVGAALWRGNLDHVTGFIIFGAALGALIGEFARSLLYIPWQSRRIYRQRKFEGRVYTLTWDDTALEGNSDQGYARLPWADFIKAKENKRLFLFYHADNLFQMIPKRWFGSEEQIERFRQAARSIGRK